MKPTDNIYADQQELPILDSNTEEATISIITVSTPEEEQRRKMRWLIYSAIAIALLALGLVVAYLVRKQWQRHTNVGVPVTYNFNQNKEQLTLDWPADTAAVYPFQVVQDEIAMKMYRIRGFNQTEGGLRASLEFQEPDTADQSVVFYSRSADHTAELEYLGSLVVDGQAYPYIGKRYHYMAILNGHLVMGVEKTERMRKYIQKQHGSFFRAFILVSDGQLPATFDLRGTEYRCAYATNRKGELYFIRTEQKQRMEDFATALLDYGFQNAIYITGGNDYNFYRDADGNRHDMADPASYPHTKWAGVIPWLVFRK